MFNLNLEWVNSFKKIIFWRKKMKSVIAMLWGMILASAWWGFGFEFYHNGIPVEGSGGFGFGFLVVVSLLVVVYSLVKFVGCICKCWDD